MSKELDLSCFSYLSSARVLRVEEYPRLNNGAEITRVIDTLAADGPMVAIAASRLGLKVGLIANSLGEDETGRSIKNNLQGNAVTNSIDNLPGKKTPFIVVLSDLSGNREWFAYIKDAQEELTKVDLSQISNPSLAYIDLYSDIEGASLRAINYASQDNVPIFLNLSGDVPMAELIAQLVNKSIAITQIGLHESREDDAEEVARQVFEFVKPKISIVTLAGKGAIAVSGKTVIKTQAYPVDILHVHGAGAAFSAGFAFGYLHNWDLQRNLEFACAFGSLNCTKERGFEDFTMEEINELLTLTKRNS